MNVQILRGKPATLFLYVYNNGTLTDLDANPTLAIIDGNGTTVSSGAVSKTPATTGTYQSTLPAQANLKVLIATWSGLLAAAAVSFRQDYEIVGNQLFTEADARAMLIVGGQAPLADTSKYSDDHIAKWRSIITDLFEARLNRGVIQRYCRVRFAGDGQPLDLTYGYPQTSTGDWLHRPGRPWDVSTIISADVNGSSVSPADIEIVGHKLYRSPGAWSGGSDQLNVTVEYEYGPDPVDWEAHQRALELLLANAAPSGLPNNATSYSNEDGTFRITVFPSAVEEFLRVHKHRAGFGVA